MTELERHLEEMGVMPVSKPKEKPESVVYDYSFKDPRDKNGEVPF
jgi:hypothetical protein